MKTLTVMAAAAIFFAGTGISHGQQTAAPPAHPPAGALGAPPTGPRPPDVVARSPAIELAVKMAMTIVASCKAFHVGVSVIDASGLPKLTYIADGTGGSHAQTAFRKANTALTFKIPSGKVAELAKTDTAVAEKIAANPNTFLFWAGGLPILAGGEIIGAVGVSGAEPSAEDERCAVEGIKQVQPYLK